jgi:hypothetical protein
VAIFTVPIQPGIPHQEMQLPIADRVYTLEFRWSVREERWYMSVFDEERVPIVVGIAIVLNFPLAPRCVSEDFWAGVMYAFDTTAANAEPSLTDLGGRVLVIYDDLEEA